MKQFFFICLILLFCDPIISMNISSENKSFFVPTFELGVYIFCESDEDSQRCLVLTNKKFYEIYKYIAKRRELCAHVCIFGNQRCNTIDYVGQRCHEYVTYCLEDIKKKKCCDHINKEIEIGHSNVLKSIIADKIFEKNFLAKIIQRNFLFLMHAYLQWNRDNRRTFEVLMVNRYVYFTVLAEKGYHYMAAMLIKNGISNEIIDD